MPIQLIQIQLLNHLLLAHDARQVHLVGKHQQQNILQALVLQDAVQFLAGLVDAGAVAGVDDEDQALRALEVVAPSVLC